MSILWDTYFDETPPKDYSFLGFYKHRSRQTDFTSSFRKESHKLKKDLANLMKDGSDEMKKGHRKYFKDVDKFWNQIERCRAEFEASSSIMQDTTEAFKTSIASVNSSIKNVNTTMLKYNEEIKSVNSTRQISENCELDDYDSPIHKDELKNTESVLGKRRNFESSDYVSSIESDGNQSPCELVKKNRMSRKIIEDVSINFPPSLISIMQEYCKKNSTSKFDLAHSYILDLSPRSKIAKEFASEYWSKLIADRPNAINVEYHKELESIFDHLFGRQKEKRPNVQQARSRWENLRNIEVPEYKEEFSYDKNDWKKILWWIEWAIGRFLSAFESERNPLMQQDCHEREWLGGYLIPIFQGALALDGRFRVAWGEVTVQASLRRRNSDKNILEERVERGHLTDLLCSTDSYEMLCLLACGGPHKVDLTKLASDEFQLPRMMKDTLDDMREKYYNNAKKNDKTCLYTIGLQQYKSEVRVYLMERRDVYRLHLIKTFDLPLTFTTFHILRISLGWAWNIRGLVNNLLEKLIDNIEIGLVTPQWISNDMITQETPEKTQKKKICKATVTGNNTNLSPHSYPF